MNTNIGGIGLRIFRPSNMQYEIIFESYYFIGNTNLNAEHQGGGLRIDYFQNNGQSKLILLFTSGKNNY